MVMEKLLDATRALALIAILGMWLTHGTLCAASGSAITFSVRS